MGNSLCPRVLPGGRPIGRPAPFRIVPPLCLGILREIPVLLGNYGGKYSGDPAFEPVWAALDRRQATVFIHPAMPGIEVNPGMPGPLVDYPFDTTRTAVQLVLNGVMTRFPHVKVILSHGGVILPYAAHRFAELAPGVRSGVPPASELLCLFQRFYFDIALSSGPAALPSLTAFGRTCRIPYGSDLPYARASVGASFTCKLDVYAALQDDEHAAINFGNALDLFPRLRK